MNTTSSAGRNAPLRFGVCGTGHWASIVHLPALAAMPDVELVGVWGRTPERSAELAQRFGIRAFDDVGAMLEAVDAVSFAVPPEIQADLALRSAEAGKHLLLEKPVATTLADADRLVETVARRGLSSITFLTRLFADEANDLIARALPGNHTRGGASYSSKALLPGTPYTNSAWRNTDYGTLWDVGPHALSILISVLGPVVDVAARRPRKARFECEMRHASGARSTATLDHMDESLTGSSREHYVFSGGDGSVAGGPFRYERERCFAAAVQRLLEGIDKLGHAAGPTIRFGRDIVAVLEAARSSIESGGTPVAVHP